jgi:butyrate kinase
MVSAALESAGYAVKDFDAFVGRGGSLEPCEGGTYEVKGLIYEHMKTLHSVKHPAALGAVLAREFAREAGVPAYTVDTPDTDELDDIARISGIKALPNRSSTHALNQKEVARRAAADLDKAYADARLVVAHIGGGISVAVHRDGRIADTTSIAFGDGPMTPTRSGSMQYLSVLNAVDSGLYSIAQLRKLAVTEGGVTDYLGTSDMREVDLRIAEGDGYAALVRDAMIYQIAKSIGAMSTALNCDFDAIVLSGGMAHSKYIVDELKKRTGRIAPILVYPGEFEMEALANGAMRVLRGEETPKKYNPSFSKISTP